MSYRMKQTERGLEAVEMLRAFLETKGGVLTVSVHETHYSSGYAGYPDLIFNEFGIEVKRVEILTKKRFNNGEKFYKNLGSLKIQHEAWNSLKEWCSDNGKKLIVVAVLTCGSLRPLFVKFTREQIDKFQQEQKRKKWIRFNFIEVLREGEIWR